MSTKKKKSADLSKHHKKANENTDLSKHHKKGNEKKHSKWTISNFNLLKKRDIGNPFSNAELKKKIQNNNSNIGDDDSPTGVMSTTRSIRIFDYRQTFFKQKLKKSQIFQRNCKNPYDIIDSFYKTLVELEKEEEVLLKKVNLNELHFPEILPLKVVRREIKEAKRMWDYIFIVNTYVDKLKTSQKIETAFIELDSLFRNIKEELSELAIKSCDACVQLVANINQALNCIYTIMKLNNIALGDDFWKEIIEAVKEKDQEEEEIKAAMQSKITQYT